MQRYSRLFGFGDLRQPENIVNPIFAVIKLNSGNMFTAKKYFVKMSYIIEIKFFFGYLTQI